MILFILSCRFSRAQLPIYIYIPYLNTQRPLIFFRKLIVIQIKLFSIVSLTCQSP